MSYFKKILIGILFVQLTSSLILSSLGHYQYNAVLKMMIDKKEKKTNALIENVFNQVNVEYTNYGNKILSNPEIIKAFENKDREKLLALTLPLYKDIIKQNKYPIIMHFHTVDTHSFLRLHKLDKFGDDLSDLRHIIVQTNKQKKIQRGLETGKHGIFYRIAFPVFKDDIHIGAFEFGIDIKYLISSLCPLERNIPYFMVLKEAVESIYKYDTNVNQYLSSFDEKYSLIKFSSDAKKKSFNINLIDKRIITNNHYLSTNNDKEYLVFRGLVLNDYMHKPIGNFIFIHDIDEFVKMIDFFKWISIISVIILFIITVGLIYKLISRYTKELEKKVYDRTNELAESIAKLKESQEQLIASEKMASLGALVAGVSHEINTPLSVGLSGISQIDHEVKRLEKNYNEDTLSEETLTQYIATMKQLSCTIYGSLDNAAKLVKSFKHISVDQHSDESRIFNLKEYIDDIVLSLKSQLKSKHVTVINTISDTIEINSYPGVFYQIFSNLILNSINHGFSDSKENIIEITAQYDRRLIIDYKDNGKGIPEAIKSKIYDPFFTTTRGQGGSGLGLSIVYNLITQKLGGTIKIFQNTSKGLHFKIVLDNSIDKGNKNG